MDIVYEQLNKSKSAAEASDKPQTGGEKTLAEKMKDAQKK